MGPARPIAVTFDVNVLVRAVAAGNSPFTHWPSPPPISAHPEADCVGIINDAEEFALWLSPHVLENTVTALVGAPPNGYGWAMQRAREYITVLLNLASVSGGGHLSPEIIVTDCEDPEVNRILALALESSSALIVSSDHHLLDMRVWRNIPIISPREFAQRTDVARRARN